MEDIDRRHHCRHFTGMMDAVCEKLVCYRDKRDSSRPGMATWPCLDPTCPTTCEKREELTAEEFEREERELLEYSAEVVRKIVAFETRETEDCPSCGQHVDSLSQVGRCVYARPCGCRIWQGRIPKAWK